MAQLDIKVTEKLTIPTAKNVLEDWLAKNFRIEQTKEGYRSSCLHFLKSIYGEEYNDINHATVGIDRYLNENRNFIDDFRLAIQWMNNTSLTPSAINSYSARLKKFFSRHGKKITEEEWKDMKLALIPANVVSTQDEVLTKEQFRNILKYLSIQGKAIALFLLSTGCRIGETLKLNIQDINLDADPPEARITSRSSKKGVGGRTVFMSYEARDAVRDWLNLKETKIKKAGGHGEYSKDLVFGGIIIESFGISWRKALERANLAKKDSVTTIRLYHVHTLRKFFSTAMSEAGLQESIIHAWMGHKGYLDSAYKRYTKEKLAQMYREHMDAVTIYEYSSSRDVQALKEEMQKSIEDAKNAVQENIKLKENEQYLRDVFKEYGVTNNRPIPEMMVDLVHKLKDQLQVAIPQPIKSEPVTPSKSEPTQVTQKSEDKETMPPPPIKPKEIPEQPTSFEPRRMVIDIKACPMKSNYVHKSVDCEECKRQNMKQYSDCYRMHALVKAGSVNDQRRELFKFALIPGTNSYQLEKTSVTQV
jgi:integrase